MGTGVPVKELMGSNLMSRFSEKPLKTVDDFMFHLKESLVDPEYPAYREDLLEFMLENNIELCKQLLEPKYYLESNLEDFIAVVFQIAAGLGDKKTMESIVEMKSNPIQVFISKNSFKAYRLAAKYYHTEILEYLESQANDETYVKLLDSGWKVLFEEIARGCVTKKDVVYVTGEDVGCLTGKDVAKYMFKFPEFRLFVDWYCNEHSYTMLNGNKRTVEHKESQQSLKEILFEFYGQLKPFERQKYEANDSLTKFMFEQVLKARELAPNDISREKIIPIANIFRLCIRHIEELNLSDLEKEQNNLESTLKEYERKYNCSWSIIWLCEQTSSALSAFFHYLDSLQSIITGSMIDKPDRIPLFRNSHRERTLDMIKEIKQQFTNKINSLKNSTPDASSTIISGIEMTTFSNNSVKNK